MSVAMIALSSDLERLLDERLDAVDRILSLSRTARSERMQILSDLESQIRDRIAARTSDAPTRADLLAVLAELDPPEAYLDEGFVKDTAFHTGRSPGESARHISSESLVASLPATKNAGGQLAIWGGSIVSIGCLITSTLLPLAVLAGLEVVVYLVIPLQVAILAGCLLAFVNLLQSRPTSGLNRLISWACCCTIPWVAIVILAWSVLLLSGDSEFVQILCLYTVPGVALVHGAWIGLFTVDMCWSKKRPEPNA